MDDKQKMPTVMRDIWRLVLAVIGVVAIVQELRKPPDERTWHGKVADFVPYDFRSRLSSEFGIPTGIRKVPSSQGRCSASAGRLTSESWRHCLVSGQKLSQVLLIRDQPGKIWSRVPESKRMTATPATT